MTSTPTEQTDLALPMIRHLGPGLPGPDRAAAAVAGYPTARQREFAIAMIERHPRAIDYLEQAPVLLLAVSMHRRRKMRLPSHEPTTSQTPHLNGKMFEDALKEWAQIVELGWRLPKVLAHYHLAPQLRAVKAGACYTSNLWALSLISMSGVDGTRLAGAIPKVMTHQRVWLTAIRHWHGRFLQRRCMDLDRWPEGLRWCALAFGRGPYDRGNASMAEDLCDFSMVAGAGFHERMTLAEACDACAAWHARDEGAIPGYGMDELGFVKTHKVQPDWEVPIAPFPLRWDCGEWSAIALVTGRQLWDEHVAMSHCVDDYFADIILGNSRIYSIRHKGERKGTVEYRGGYSVKHSGPRAQDVGIETEVLPDGSRREVRVWRFGQFKAKRNHRPVEEAWKAKAMFDRHLESIGVRFMTANQYVQQEIERTALAVLQDGEPRAVPIGGGRSAMFIIDDPHAPDEPQS